MRFGSVNFPVISHLFAVLSKELDFQISSLKVDILEMYLNVFRTKKLLSSRCRLASFTSARHDSEDKYLVRQCFTVYGFVKCSDRQFYEFYSTTESENCCSRPQTGTMLLHHLLIFRCQIFLLYFHTYLRKEMRSSIFSV